MKKLTVKARFFFGTIFLLLSGLIVFIYLRLNATEIIAAPGETVELVFELDKKFEFGEYYFDLGNGKDATCLLCYCLAKDNRYPPDCKGDIKYIYNNLPGAPCIPLHIGNGTCVIKSIMNSAGYASKIIIPLEYGWTKPVEKIIMGVNVPSLAADKSTIIVEVTIFRKNELGKLEVYRTYDKTVGVRRKEIDFDK